MKLWHSQSSDFTDFTLQEKWENEIVAFENYAKQQAGQSAQGEILTWRDGGGALDKQVARGSPCVESQTGKK